MMIATKEANHWPTTAGYYAVFVIVGMVTATLGPTLPALAGQTGVQLDQISLLFTAHALGYMVGSFLSGQLYDRTRGHPVMATMLVVIAVLLGLIPLVPVLWLLAGVWLLVGVAGGALDVGGNTLLVWVHGREVAPFMNGLHFFFGVGSSLGPAIVAMFLAMGSQVRGTYWALALLVLPVAFWLSRVPSPQAPAAAAAAGQSSIGSRPRPGTEARTSEGLLVGLIALLLVLYCGAEISYGGWVYSYALALNLATETSAAYLTSAFWGALTAGRLLSIPLAARFRPRTILFVDLLGCLLSTSVVLLWPGSLAVLWLGTLGVGASMASIFPTALTLAGRRVRVTGRVTAWFLVGASIGGMALPWLIGQLFESIGPVVTMAAILGALVADLAVFGLLMLASRRLSA